MINIVVDTSYSEDTVESIARGLRFLCSTIEGSYPLDRSFGLEPSFLDMNPPQAANMLALDLRKKIPEFDERVKLKSISVKPGIDGTLNITVTVKGADD